MRNTLILSTTLFLAAQSFGQDHMPVTAANEEARQNFIEAREILSLVWVSGGVEQMELALEQDPKLALAHVYKGISYAFLGKDRMPSFEAARKHAASATEGEYWMIEGWIHMFSGNRDSSEYAFAQVVQLHPKEDYARHILGDVYRIQDRYEDALAMLKPLVNRKDPYIGALNHTAYTYKDMGQKDSALVYMQRFIDADPADANAYHSMAEMQLAFGDVSKASDNFQKALLADPYFAAATRDHGDLLAENGETVLAEKAYELALDRGPRLYGHRFMKGVQERLDKLRKP